MLRVLLAVAITATLGACSTESDTTTAGPETDASTTLACRHFRNIAGDVRDGILSETELRVKMKEVHDSARLSESDAIRDSATAMLRSATDGTDAGTSVEDFSAACATFGL